jgi:hypothetical protein
VPGKTPEGEAQEKRNQEMDTLLRALAQSSPASEETPSEFQFLDEKRRVVELKILQDHADQDIALREKYATWLLRILAAELVVVNAIFVAYAWAGEDWKIPEA